MENQEKG